MNITFIVPGMGMGGAERVISILSKGFVEKGHSVSIGMFNVTPQSVSYQLDERVSVENVMSFRFSSFYRIKQSFRSLEEYIRKVNPDVVISFTNVICSQVSIVCKKMGIPLIFSERNDPRRLLTGRKEKIFQKILLHNIRYVVFQTEGAKNLYPNKIAQNSIVILNPLDTSKHPPYFEGKRKKEIVTVGRLEPQKRQDILIRAFAEIADNYSEYVLRIYGEGTQRGALSELIKELHLEERVFLMGTRNNIFDCINESAIFAFTSDFEGLPNALIEAMSLGIPCVSTRCSPGGAEEVIEDGKNGYLVSCGDFEELSMVLSNMINNYDNSLNVGREAINVRKRVDKQEVIDSWECFIYGVVKDR